MQGLGIFHRLKAGVLGEGAVVEQGQHPSQVGVADGVGVAAAGVRPSTPHPFPLAPHARQHPSHPSHMGVVEGAALGLAHERCFPVRLKAVSQFPTALST